MLSFVLYCSKSNLVSLVYLRYEMNKCIVSEYCVQDNKMGFMIRVTFLFIRKHTITTIGGLVIFLK